MPTPATAASAIPTSAAPGRWHYPGTQTPDASFYAHFQAAYADHAREIGGASPDTTSLSVALQDVLGAAHVDRMVRAGVGEVNLARYAQVLNKVYSGEAMNDPQAFLRSLSMQEMEALRINHGLADTIDVSQISREGASNLLLPEGYSVDLNRDGLEEVGAARIMHFPPRDAPAEFVAQWRESTADLDPGDEMTYCLQMHTALFGLHLSGQAAPVDQPALATDRLDSYRTAVSRLLESLEVSKPFNTLAWYERSKAFYGQLQALLA